MSTKIQILIEVESLNEDDFKDFQDSKEDLRFELEEDYFKTVVRVISIEKI